MRHLVTAHSSAEAHMICHMLEGHGIEASVQGDYLQGAAGGIPTTGHIKVSVPDKDYEKAREILEAFEKANPTPKTSTHKDHKNPIAGITLSLFIGLVCGAFFMDLYNRAPMVFSYYDKNNNYIEEADHNDDGLIDTRWHLTRKGVLLKTESDRNFDGNFDQIDIFDRKGLLKEIKYDDNFDGEFETISYFDDLKTSRTKTDRDMDGNIETLAIFESNILVKMYFYSGSSPKPVKIEYFKDGFLDSAEFDSDKDGKLDTRYFYDRFYEIKKTEAIQD